MNLASVGPWGLWDVSLPGYKLLAALDVLVALTAGAQRPREHVGSRRLKKYSRKAEGVG